MANASNHGIQVFVMMNSRIIRIVMSQISNRRVIAVALVALSVFFVELGGARLWDRDEPRNSRASHEMLERSDWIVPTFNGELRTHKPILLYWGQMLSYQVLGESEFTARLPSALCALLSIIAIAILGSRLSGRSKGISNEGFWAAGVLATSLLFVMAGRAATPDSCLIAFSTVGIAALVLSSTAPAPPYSSGNVRSARWATAMFGYAMLGFAVLAKGPVGIVLPVAVVHAWWMVCRWMQFRSEGPSERSLGVFAAMRSGIVDTWGMFNPLQCLRAIWALKLIPGVLVALLICAPWYYWVGVATEGEFLRGFLWEHNVGRAMNSMEGHGGSIFYYPIAFLVGTFPWSLWLIPIVAWCRHAGRDGIVQRQMVVLAGMWVGVYVVAFSVASTKLPSYITPCYAGASLAIGGYLRQFESEWSLPARWIRYLAYSVSIVVGIAITGGLFALSKYEAMPLLIGASSAGAIISALGLIGFVFEKTRNVRRVPVAWLFGATAFHIVLFGFGTKSVDRYRHDLRILAEVKSETKANHWLTIGGMEPSWVHYLDSKIVEIQDSPRDAGSWRRVEEFLAVHPDGKLVVVGDEALQCLGESLEQVPGTLVELAKAPRFMRPGNMAIYEIQTRESLTANANQVETPNASPSDKILAERSGLAIAEAEARPDVDVPSLDITLPDIPSLEKGGMPPVVKIEVEPRRVAKQPQFPNPLRQK